MDERKKELEAKLKQLHTEEDEFSKVIIYLSKFPNTTEALLAAYSTTKECYMETLQDLRELALEDKEDVD